jgi:hypothetical protein
VDGKVYFVDKLLQESSGAYFIPKWFFLGSLSVEDSAKHHKQPSGKILYALGCTAQWTDVSDLLIYYV